MSEWLADILKREGIRDDQVLQAMTVVLRHHFVDQGLVDSADVDQALPIGCGQTISQPYVVARMTELLLTEFKPKHVLEIGTGSGYQAAILAKLVEQVYSVERIKLLYEQAKERLEQLGYRNIQLNYADGMTGWVEYAPFDGIIVTAATKKIPEAWLEQLACPGKMVVPLGDPLLNQHLCVISKQADGSISQKTFDPVVFVPLLSGKDDGTLLSS